MIDQEAFERDGALHLPRRLAPAEVEGLRLLADARIGGRPGARLDR